MKEKTLIILVVVLAVVAAFETGYVMKIRQYPWIHRVYMMPYWHMMMPSMRTLDSKERNFQRAEGWYPLEDVVMMQRETDHLFDNSFMRALKNEEMEAKALLRPQIGLRESKTEYIITADIPGMNKEDIGVETSDHTLMIAGERKIGKETGNEKIYKQEESYGYFSRRIRLPDYVDTANITSEYLNGVLTIRMPLMGSRKNAEGVARKIPVK